MTQDPKETCKPKELFSWIKAFEHLRDGRKVRFIRDASDESVAFSREGIGPAVAVLHGSTGSRWFMLKPEHLGGNCWETYEEP